eukprot:5332375-Pyramimonas_sp.AAC.1
MPKNPQVSVQVLSEAMASLRGAIFGAPGDRGGTLPHCIVGALGEGRFWEPWAGDSEVHS